MKGGLKSARKRSLQAAASPAGNATSIMVNISAPATHDTAAGGSRKGQVSVTPSIAPRRRHGEAFDVLPGESTVDLRVLTDRSIVEARPKASCSLSSFRS